MSCGRERNQRPGSDLSPATAQLAGQVRHIRSDLEQNVLILLLIKVEFKPLVSHKLKALLGLPLCGLLAIAQLCVFTMYVVTGK